MGIAAKTYIALMLSLVLLAGGAVAPACAHGASCAYATQRGWVPSAMPTHSAALSHTMHCGLTPDTMPATMPMKQGADSCCGDSSGSRMRLADDRANFTQVPSTAVAFMPLAVVPQQASALLPPLPAASAPPQRALSSTIIRI